MRVSGRTARRDWSTLRTRPGRCPTGPARLRQGRPEPGRIQLQRRQLSGHRRVQPRRRLRALTRSWPRPPRQRAARPPASPLPARRSARRRPRSPACAEFLAERGQRVGLDPVLARQPANVEQPRLDRLQPRRVERQRLGGAGDLVLGLAGLDHRPVEAGQRLGQQRMVGGAALDPPGRLPQLCQRPFRAAEQLVEPGQRLAGLGAGLHRRPLLGQLRFLARLPAPARRFPGGMLQPVAVALGRFGRRAPRPARPRRSTSPQASGDALCRSGRRRRAAPVAARVEQAAVVMLAVDLDQPVGDVAQQPAGRAAAGEGAAAAVGLQRPAQDQRLARLGLDPLLGQQREGGMVGGQARSRPRRWPAAALPHQSGVGATPSARPRGCRAGSTCRRRSRRSARPGPARTPARAGRSAPHRGSTSCLSTPPHPGRSSAWAPPTARAAGSAHSCACTICCPDSCGRARRRPCAPRRAGRARDRFRPAARAPRACGWSSDICRPRRGSG